MRGAFNYLRVVLLLAVTMITSCVFAQDVSSVSGSTEFMQPIDFTQYFVSFAAFIFLVPFVVEGLKKLFRVTKGYLSIIISWITGIVLAIVAHFLSLGIFGDFTIIQTLITGFGGSLAANGVFDTGLITKILEILIPKLRKHK